MWIEKQERRVRKGNRKEGLDKEGTSGKREGGRKGKKERKAWREEEG